MLVKGYCPCDLHGDSNVRLFVTDCVDTDVLWLLSHCDNGW